MTDPVWVCWDPDNGLGVVMTGFRSEAECREWMTRRAVSEGWGPDPEKDGLYGLEWSEAEVVTTESDPTRYMAK